METILLFSHYDYNNLVIMAYCCSNDSIWRIKSITLFNAHDSEHCSSWENFPSTWKQRYYFRVEVVSNLSNELCSCVYISVNQKLTKYGHLVQWHRNFVFGEFQSTVHCHHPKNMGTFCSDNTIVYSRSLKQLSIIITQKNMVPWCSGTVIVFLEVLNDWA